MQFKLATFATLLAVSAAAPARRQDNTCASNVVATLNTLTQEVQTVQNTASGITLVNIFTSVPILIRALADNISTLQRGAGLPCETELSAEEQQRICDAASAFVTADTALIRTLTSQNSVGVVSNTPFAAPLGVVGRELERATDLFILPIIDATPTCGASVGQLVQTLDTELAQLVDTYQS
ncbi:hypothetical protein BJX62DRAFT_240420 [Aspergillus germanicus]